MLVKPFYKIAHWDLKLYTLQCGNMHFMQKRALYKRATLDVSSGVSGVYFLLFPRVELRYR